MPKRTDIHKVLIIGSGPIIIGQACEFDYSGTQACKALKKLGYEIVLVNSNPATIMTDPETADVTYIEPLNVERLTQIIEKERPDALLPNLGGQSGLNLCSELSKAGILEKYDVKVIGVQVDAIERGEDRIEFKHTMDSLGIEMARSEVAYTVDEAVAIAEKLGYPVVLRPAYTMGGAGGGLVYNVEELKTVTARGLQASLVGQVLVDAAPLLGLRLQGGRGGRRGGQGGPGAPARPAGRRAGPGRGRPPGPRNRKPDRPVRDGPGGRGDGPGRRPPRAPPALHHPPGPARLH